MMCAILIAVAYVIGALTMLFTYALMIANREHR